jgi:hypothetical protein
LSLQLIVFPNDENSELLDEGAINEIIMVIENMKDFYETGGVEEY